MACTPSAARQPRPQICDQATKFKCCAAISHLQHKVEIPNYRVRCMAAFPASLQVAGSNALEYRVFPSWHGSC